MRSSIRRPYAYFTMVLIAVVLLIQFYGAVNAKSPKAGYYTIYGEIVEADPGEDPHMKVNPLFDSGLILDFKENKILGYSRLRGYRDNGTTPDELIHCRDTKNLRKTKLIITRQIPFGSLFR